MSQPSDYHTGPCVCGTCGRQQDTLDVERLARALEAVSFHVGPSRTVSFVEFAKIIAAEYAALGAAPDSAK